jgi:hypothetical protein
VLEEGAAGLPQALSKSENAMIVEKKMKLSLRIFYLLCYLKFEFVC